MTSATRDRLAAMNDVQIAAFFKHWATSLVDGAQTDLDVITSAVPAEVQQTPGFAAVTEVDAEGEIRRGAADVARAVLLPMADDSELGPTIDAALETYDDSLMMVDVILALGLVASVLLIVATTEFDGNLGPVKFHKGKADPETVKAVIGSVFEVLKPFLGG
jgi:hypothetical protein